jgi:hypothetical protein
MLTFAFPASAQQLSQGKFFLSTVFTYEEFTFKRNQNFEYRYSSCTGDNEGWGTYTFKKGNLHLIFENPKNKPLQTSTVQFRPPTINDSSIISFRF